MRAFIDQYRHAYGAEPIRRVMQVAPSAIGDTPRGGATLSCVAHEPSATTRRASTLNGVWQANRHVYGADKVRRRLRREGTDLARCTVERLMSKAGPRGVMCGNVVRTTVADAKAP